jgi:hypothetical protein
MSERIWQCTCGWGHFLSIHQDDDTPYIIFEGSYRATTLKEKLRACWEIFRRGHYDTWLEVQLDEQTTREVRNELSRMVDSSRPLPNQNIKSLRDNTRS